MFLEVLCAKLEFLSKPDNNFQMIFLTNFQCHAVVHKIDFFLSLIFFHLNKTSETLYYPQKRQGLSMIDFITFCGGQPRQSRVVEAVCCNDSAASGADLHVFIRSYL